MKAQLQDLMLATKQPQEREAPESRFAEPAAARALLRAALSARNAEEPGKSRWESAEE